MNNLNDKQLSNEPNRMTTEIPFCPKKKEPCSYWTSYGCSKPARWLGDKR